MAATFTPSGPPISLIDSDTVVRVSSTLDKSVGKKYLTDGSNETCWASANGLPQSLTLTFPSAILPSSILLTFAGGFVGTNCTFSTLPLSPSSTKKEKEKEWIVRNRFFPEDVNRKQTFDLPRPDGEQQGEEERGAREVKVEFEKGSDFFGRITIYELEVWGWRVEGADA
ncbi:galactose-binding domain-like protein [Mrakia frigida]|uniref:galactose-binding domain-like protein n=1 Tax=Mrakia frigida TaxID=29902 RepID=UPI003FCC0B91